MFDRITVMRAGRVGQPGNARDTYEALASALVATFIGTTNTVRARAGAAADATVRFCRTVRTVCRRPRIEVHAAVPGGTALVANVADDGSRAGAAGDGADLRFGPCDAWAIRAGDGLVPARCGRLAP